MKLLPSILFFALFLTGNCALKEADVANKWPFCTNIALQQDDLEEDFSDGVGGETGSTFLTCTIKYWQDASLDSGEQKIPDKITVLIDIETGEPQTPELYDGWGIPSGDSDLLDDIKKNLLTFNGSYDELHYFEDEFFMIDGIRLVFNDPEKENLVRFWYLPIEYGSEGIFLQPEQWIPESKFLSDVKKINELYGDDDESDE